MRDLMTIGRFSRATQLTIKALRLYDRVGLLRPAVVDLQSGFRYYSVDQAAVAARIRLLRALQMPLEEIRVLLHESDSQTARACLARHRRRLEERITALQNALTILQALDDDVDHLGGEHVMVMITYRCSCCGKSHMQARQIIVGPQGLYLCNECIWAGNERAAEHHAARCSLCGAEDDRPTRCLRDAAPAIRACDECLALCREIVGAEPSAP